MAAYALRMKHDQPPPMIYQLRIVLRDISPLIWRRLLVYSDTTLAHLHHMLQILFAWSDEHLHHFHIFGKDYGSNAADTRHVTLQSFAFQPSERFRYIYNYYAQWQCDIRLEATLPCDTTRFYPVCTGGKWPAPPEHVQDAQSYLSDCPWIAVFPGLMIFLTVVCCNVLSDFLGEATNPARTTSR